jgi:predicted secreted protein
MTFFADRSDTSCSADFPPKRIPTRIRRTIILIHSGIIGKKSALLESVSAWDFDIRHLAWLHINFHITAGCLYHAIVEIHIRSISLHPHISVTSDTHHRVWRECIDGAILDNDTEIAPILDRDISSATLHRNFFSSSQRHGNYIQKNYIITFDGENFTVEVKQKELPPEHFGQR